MGEQRVEKMELCMVVKIWKRREHDLGVEVNSRISERLRCNAAKQDALHCVLGAREARHVLTCRLSLSKQIS